MTCFPGSCHPAGLGCLPAALEEMLACSHTLHMHVGGSVPACLWAICDWQVNRPGHRGQSLLKVELQLMLQRCASACDSTCTAQPFWPYTMSTSLHQSKICVHRLSQQHGSSNFMCGAGFPIALECWLRQATCPAPAPGTAAPLKDSQWSLVGVCTCLQFTLQRG